MPPVAIRMTSSLRARQDLVPRNDRHCTCRGGVRNVCRLGARGRSESARFSHNNVQKVKNNKTGAGEDTGKERQTMNAIRWTAVFAVVFLFSNAQAARADAYAAIAYSPSTGKW